MCDNPGHEATDALLPVGVTGDRLFNRILGNPKKIRKRADFQEEPEPESVR
jgi:hypothetical protein